MQKETCHATRLSYSDLVSNLLSHADSLTSSHTCTVVTKYHTCHTGNDRLFLLLFYIVKSAFVFSSFTDDLEGFVCMANMLSCLAGKFSLCVCVCMPLALSTHCHHLSILQWLHTSVYFLYDDHENALTLTNNWIVWRLFRLTGWHLTDNEYI